MGGVYTLPHVVSGHIVLPPKASCILPLLTAEKTTNSYDIRHKGLNSIYYTNLDSSPFNLFIFLLIFLLSSDTLNLLSTQSIFSHTSRSFYLFYLFFFILILYFFSLADCHCHLSIRLFIIYLIIVILFFLLFTVKHLGPLGKYHGQ